MLDQTSVVNDELRSTIKELEEKNKKLISIIDQNSYDKA